MSTAGQERRSFWKVVGLLVLAGAVLAPVAYRVLETVPNPAPPGTVVITYMAWGNPQQLDAERRVIAAFNERYASATPPIRVDLFMPPAAGYEAKLRLMLATNTAPDVVRADHYYFPSLVPKGYFLDLTPFILEDQRAGRFDPSDFHPAAMRENLYDGKIYGLNTLFGGVVCYYNKDAFAKAGLEDPYLLWKRGQAGDGEGWTWEAFTEAAERLTERDPRTGRTVRFGYLINSQGSGGPPPWLWPLFVWAEGGDILSADHSRCVLDSPEAIRGFERLQNLLYGRRVSPTPADSAAAAYTFESGTIAMEFSWAGQAPRYRAIRDFAWDVVPTPHARGKPFALVKGNQLVISAGSRHPREAWEWVKYMTGPEAERRLYGEEYRRNVPTRRSVLADPVYLAARQAPRHIDVFAKVLDNARHLPIDHAWPVWTSELQRDIDRMFGDAPRPAAEVLPGAAATVNRALAAERERFARYLKPDGDEPAGGGDGR